MKIVRRSITIGAATALAVLSFAAGVYFAVNYGSAPKLESGLAKAAEPPDAPTAGRSDNKSPAADSVELSDTQLKFVKVATRSRSATFRSRSDRSAASTSTRSC